MAKNGEYIGERYVRLLHVPRSEMEEQVTIEMDRSSSPRGIPSTCAAVTFTEDERCVFSCGCIEQESKWHCLPVNAPLVGL